MNCNKEGKECSHKHSPIKHMLHMIVCCGLPIIIILSLPFVTKLSPQLATFLGVIAPFICPIMMGGMMFMMFNGNKKKAMNESTIEEKESGHME
ncbi:MAG: uncharacterized protein K0R21_906 [Anaerocolumna sp.]|jgi:hypothetical protein|nr:uncharacterized protein [Anaerocolumna sp.]